MSEGLTFHVTQSLVYWCLTMYSIIVILFFEPGMFSNVQAVYIILWSLSLGHPLVNPVAQTLIVYTLMALYCNDTLMFAILHGVWLHYVFFHLLGWHVRLNGVMMKVRARQSWMRRWSGFDCWRVCGGCLGEWGGVGWANLGCFVSTRRRRQKRAGGCGAGRAHWFWLVNKAHCSWRGTL